MVAKIVAVLTGDVIGSTELDVLTIGAVRKSVADTINDFRLKRPNAIRGEADFYRGDAWQLLLAEPRWALRLALLIRARLRAKLDVDTRISIGLGEAGKTSRRHTSLSTGEAFVVSGRALDKMTGYFDLTAALPERADAMAIWLPVALRLCGGLIKNWTRRQAEIVGYALTLDTPTHENIAKSLRPRIVKQSVTDTLGAADWRPMLEVIKAFEITDWAELLKRK